MVCRSALKSSQGPSSPLSSNDISAILGSEEEERLAEEEERLAGLVFSLSAPCVSASPPEKDTLELNSWRYIVNYMVAELMDHGPLNRASFDQDMTTFRS